MMEENPITKQVIAFDFDGVFVLDSDAVFKRDAWKKALAPWAGRYEPLLEEGNRLFGSGKSGGRREILQYVFEQLGESPERLPALIGEAAQAFNTHLQGEIAKAGLAPGALQMLEILAARGFVLYINSGTPPESLRESIRILDIERFFRDALGTTKSKVANVRYIAAQEGMAPGEVTVVGDGESDRATAEELHTRFIGVANQHNKWAEMRPQFEIVTKLDQVPELL